MGCPVAISKSWPGFCTPSTSTVFRSGVNAPMRYPAGHLNRSPTGALVRASHNLTADIVAEAFGGNASRARLHDVLEGRCDPAVRPIQ